MEDTTTPSNQQTPPTPATPATPPVTPPATPPASPTTPPTTTPTQPATPVTPPVTPTPPNTIPASVPPPTTPMPQTTPQTAAPLSQEKLDEIKADVEKTTTEKVSKSVIARIGEALGLTKKEEEEEVPTDPKKLGEYIDRRVEDKTKEVLKSRDAETEETTKEQEEKLQEGAKNFQETWAYQYTEMATLGNVPKIEKPQDPQDPGNVAKSRLLLKLKEVLDENEKNGVDYVPSLWEIMSKYPNVLKTAGANVPVSGRGRTTADAPRMPYDKLHKTSIETMVEDQNK